MNCGDVSDADAVVAAKYLDTIPIQNRKLALGGSKPHAAQAVGKLDHDPRLGKVVTTAIGCPETISQAVQAVTSERDPHSAAGVLCDCLEEGNLISNLLGQVNSNETTIGQTPETVCSADPESLVGTVVC